jgi:hypothetical protein
MLAFRKSGGDWTNKPTHAARACLDAVKYRLPARDADERLDVKPSPFRLPKPVTVEQIREALAKGEADFRRAFARGVRLRFGRAKPRDHHE